VELSPASFPCCTLLGGDVVFRTAPGEKLIAAALVATSCSRSTPTTSNPGGWSVNVVGPVEGSKSRPKRARAEALGLEPWAGEVRDRYVRLHARAVTGRRICTGTEGGPP
jgi:hypothetical protein